MMANKTTLNLSIMVLSQENNEKKYTIINEIKAHLTKPIRIRKFVRFI
jgi:hypothetical protein